nr:MAG TPA: hypothetical protein [Caudoviricetes sp.]
MSSHLSFSASLPIIRRLICALSLIRISIYTFLFYL